MKIIGISDIHGNLINIPKCDVLCIAGDIINLNDQRNNEASDKWWRTRFVKWANTLDCGKIFVVPGNHDFYLDYLYKDKDKYQKFINLIYTLTFGKVEILIDTLTEYKGKTFYGCPWIQPITFQIGKWAFESDNLKELYNKIPICDVLITHDSPKKNDLLSDYGLFKPKIWFYGHWHEEESDEKLGLYNCSRLDDYYNFKKNYKFVEIDMEKTKYELLQEITEGFKDLIEPLLDTIPGPERDEYLAKIDELLINFVNNTNNNDIDNWSESSMINDNYDETIDIDDEYK